MVKLVKVALLCLVASLSCLVRAVLITEDVVHFSINHSNLILTPFRYLIHNHTNLYFTLNPIDSVVKEKSQVTKPKHQEARGRCIGGLHEIKLLSSLEQVFLLETEDHFTHEIECS